MQIEREYQTHRAAAIFLLVMSAVILWPCSTLLGGDYRVLEVHDGDTIKVVSKRGGDPISVRLAEIDAPELAQPHGKESRDYLSKMLKFGDEYGEVDLQVQTRDRYGRLVAIVVQYESKLWQVNSHLVRMGQAWHYKQYSRSKELADFEKEARAKRRGLWRKSNPQPPWEYRAAKRKKAA